MPEYQAPGVHVEDTGFRPKIIEGVNTSTTAFVGLTAKAPQDGPLEPLTSFADFERVYGGLGMLHIAGVHVPNYVAHAARAFFAEGGQRLYVARLMRPADGRSLTVEDYVGEGRPTRTGLAALEGCDDVSLVAAPGVGADDALGCGVARALLRHVEQHRYRFAILDSIRGQSIDAVRRLRRDLDSSRAALYYPWVVAADPLAGRWRRHRLVLPPSGFICGIYARVDTRRGVHGAPAKEVVRSARGLDARITARQQEVLNAEGINCLRSFWWRGPVAWGARTVSSDPEWKYINNRRYFLYLEQSIERGTQWAVFEPNGEPLWKMIRQAVETFLFSEFRVGALRGTKPEQAFFVRCDRTTMTQNDIDNGHLVCEIGVAPSRPAEFVIFRIGHKTASAQS